MERTALKSKFSFTNRNKMLAYLLSVLFFILTTMKFFNQLNRSEIPFPIDAIGVYGICCCITYSSLQLYRLGIYLLTGAFGITGTLLLFFVYEPSELQLVSGTTCIIGAFLLGLLIYQAKRVNN